jgi:hypothetical protein
MPQSPIDAVWDAMQSLPKPVDETAALDAAAHILDPQGLTQQFREWWRANGAHVLRRLNG